KCTAIRRVIVPRAQQQVFVDALSEKLAQVVVGDPETEGVTMGALASRGQVAEVRERVADLQKAGARIVCGDPNHCDVVGAGAETGAFIAPLLLATDDGAAHPELHAIEAFGPVATVVPYDSTAEAI